eukprot:TRINITY_DN7271_c0_g1_i1.p1 TRINITY_DN7271_c0_g1~~TRINITY_DN7271_c0_g1_i1.p1  ORF type:complete len:959 (-),score=194.05 TRINITY_DN7271_c0_g1_i1:211-3087(-)
MAEDGPTPVTLEVLSLTASVGSIKNGAAMRRTYSMDNIEDILRAKKEAEENLVKNRRVSKAYVKKPSDRTLIKKVETFMLKKKDKDSSSPLSSRTNTPRGDKLSNDDVGSESSYALDNKIPSYDPLSTVCIFVIGHQFVDWLIDEGFSQSYEGAIDLSEKMMELGFLSPVEPCERFDPELSYNYKTFGPVLNNSGKKIRSVSKKLKAKSITTVPIHLQSENTLSTHGSSPVIPSLSHKSLADSQEPDGEYTYHENGLDANLKSLSSPRMNRSMSAESIESPTPTPTPNQPSNSPDLNTSREASVPSIVTSTEAESTTPNLKTSNRSLLSRMTSRSLTSPAPESHSARQKTLTKKKSRKRMHDLDKFRMTLELEAFSVQLPDNEILSYFYHPEQTLTSILDKVSKVKNMNIEECTVVDTKGNVVSGSSLLKDLATRHVIIRRGVLSNNLDISNEVAEYEAPDKLLLFRHRDGYEIDELNERINNYKAASLVKRNRKSKLSPRDSKFEKYSFEYLHIGDLEEILNGKISYDIDSSTGYFQIKSTTIQGIFHLWCLNEKDSDFMGVHVILSFDTFVVVREFFEKFCKFWSYTNSSRQKKRILEFLSMFVLCRSDVLLNELMMNVIDSWLETQMKFDDNNKELLKDFDKSWQDVVKNARKASVMDYVKLVPHSPSNLVDEHNDNHENFISIPTHSKPDFFDFEVAEIARHLCYLDHLYIQRISIHEWHKQGWLKGRSPNIVNTINNFNLVSLWVQTLIVLSKTKELRLLVISQWILIAVECLALQDFSALMAIVAGLTATPVSRLKQTWNDLDQNFIKVLEKLEQITSIQNKFKNLREAQEQSVGPVVPYIGIYLNDLTMIDEGNPNKVEVESSDLSLTNLLKMDMIAKTLLKIEDFKSRKYDMVPNAILLDFIMHKTVLDEDNIFEESLKREARESTTQNSSSSGNSIQVKRKITKRTLLN